MDSEKKKKVVFHSGGVGGEVKVIVRIKNR